MTLPVEVVVRESGKLVGYACGECGRFYAAPVFLDEEAARSEALANTEQCCTPRVCEKCSAPMGERLWLVCPPCVKQAEEDRDRDAFDKATKVNAADYDGWVSWSDHGPNEGYFASVDDLLTYCEDEGCTLPAYVWGCSELPFHMSAERAIEDALDEHYEEARHKIADTEVERLQAFLDEWCEKQEVKSYFEDRGTAVMIRKG